MTCEGWRWRHLSFSFSAGVFPQHDQMVAMTIMVLMVSVITMMMMMMIMLSYRGDDLTDDDDTNDDRVDAKWLWCR